MWIDKKEYDNVKLGSKERLTAGGHKCVIKEAREGKSQKGYEMIIISLDTTEEDAQPLFYTNDYLSQDDGAKKWHCTHYISKSSEYFMSTLKKFVNAVETSNEGFKGVQDDGNIDFDTFRNKKVGVVFREEEYIANTGNKGRNVKPFYFCSYDKAFEQDVPSPKTIDDPAPAFAPASDPAAASEGFLEIPAGVNEDDGLPFR